MPPLSRSGAWLWRCRARAAAARRWPRSGRHARTRQPTRRGEERCGAMRRSSPACLLLGGVVQDGEAPGARRSPVPEEAPGAQLTALSFQNSHLLLGRCNHDGTRSRGVERPPPARAFSFFFSLRAGFVLYVGAGPSLPGLRSRAVVVPSSLRTRNHDAATVAGARHDLVGRTVLVECVPPRRDALRDSGDETRLEGRPPRRHGWQPWRGALPLKVGYGSARNSLADTRARRPYDGCAAVARLPSHMPRRAI